MRVPTGISGISDAMTIYDSKYRTRSSSFMLRSSREPILLGRLFRYQMCATGAAKEM